MLHLQSSHVSLKPIRMGSSEMIRHISATAYPILYKVAVASSIIPKHSFEKDHMTEDPTTKNSKRSVGQVLDIVGFVGRELNGNVTDCNKMLDCRWCWYTTDNKVYVCMFLSQK